MKRRDFLATGVAVGTLAGIALTPQRATAFDALGTAPVDQRAKARLRFSSQLRGWIPGNGDAAKMRQMKAWGMEAVEPTGRHVDSLEKAREYKKMADDAGLKVSAMVFPQDCGCNLAV